MSRTPFVFAAALLTAGVLLAVPGTGQEGDAPTPVAAASSFVSTLDAAERELAVRPGNDPERLGWHFIPKDDRKGLPLNRMTEPQRGAARDLLRSVLSAAGYSKATRIMALEGLLAELEKNPVRRDPLKYYVTLFGDPAGDPAGERRWGLSWEGHHLSLNVTFAGDEFVSGTPQFLGSNPARVPAGLETETQFRPGERVLADVEDLGFALLDALTAEQRAVAVLTDDPPREIRAAGEPQPPTDPAAGLAADRLTEPQRAMLAKLIAAHAAPMPGPLRAARMEEVDDTAPADLHFAWMGAATPGVGHGYRVEGPTFVIEFVNSQPDSLGNPANHAHSVWRDVRGDFGVRR